MPPQATRNQKDWNAIGKQRDMQTAELACVVDALSVVEERWRELNEYMAKLLLSEDFMDPKAYAELLFDDETYTRSRGYFWIIGCLNEFDVSIRDNIKQWELFKQARVIPLVEAKLEEKLEAKLKGKLDTKIGEKLDTKRVAELEEELRQFQALNEEADNLCEILEDLRSQFQNKLTTVQALRDGVSCILIIWFLYSTRLSSVCPTGSIVDDLLLSFSTPVLSSRVEPRPGWDRMSCCLPMSASFICRWHSAL